MKPNWTSIGAIALLAPPLATGILGLIAFLTSRLVGRELLQDQFWSGAIFAWAIWQIIVLLMIWRRVAAWRAQRNERLESRN